MNISDMELLGSGAEADIYLNNGKAIKLFKSAQTLSAARREAELQARASQAGLPVPAVYEVCEIDGKPAITMEYIRGKTIGEVILHDMENITAYMEQSVDLQRKVHGITAHHFPRQKDVLSANISAAPYLTSSRKQGLLEQLQNLEAGEMLCHGDFHVLNLIQTDDDIKIIDWVCATAGSVLADVCRTYLLYLLFHPELAQLYLELYCQRSTIAKQDVLVWLPVIAGARLSENVGQKDRPYLLELVSSR